MGTIKTLKFEICIFKPLSSFIGYQPGEVYSLVAERHYRMPSPPGCPQIIYNIMKSCWRADPGDRPTFEVLRHELDIYQVSLYEDLGKKPEPLNSWIPKRD